MTWMLVSGSVGQGAAGLGGVAVSGDAAGSRSDLIGVLITCRAARHWQLGEIRIFGSKDFRANVKCQTTNKLC